MFNKSSCRACGCYLVPTSVCNICTEHVSWICGQCDRIDDSIHSHNDQLISYKPEKIALGTKKILHTIIYSNTSEDINPNPRQELNASRNSLPFDIMNQETAAIKLYELIYRHNSWLVLI